VALGKMSLQSAVVNCISQFMTQFGESFFADAVESLDEKHYRFIRVLFQVFANFIPGLPLIPMLKVI
jgi:hypothetical protein